MESMWNSPWNPRTQSIWSPWTVRMDSMEFIKIIVVHGLSMNSLWTVKTEFGCVYCQNRIRGICGMSVESMNPHGVHKDYLGE